MLSSYLSFLLCFLHFWAVLSVSCLLFPSSLAADKTCYPGKIFAGEPCWQKDVALFCLSSERKAVLHTRRRWPYFGRVNSILGWNPQDFSGQKTNAYTTYKLLNIQVSVTFVLIFFFLFSPLTFSLSMIMKQVSTLRTVNVYPDKLVPRLLNE